MRENTIPTDRWTADQRHEEIKRSVTAVSLILTAFLYLFWIEIVRSRPELIGWYRDGRAVAPLFREDILAVFLPWWIGGFVITVLSHLIKLVQAAWTVPVIIIHLVEQIYSGVVGILFLLQKGLITDDFTAEFAEFAGVTVSRMEGNLKISLYILSGIIVLSILINIIQAGGRLYKRL